MARIFDAADSRGCARHASLTSRRTFSFADYHNPQRMGFGVLRVLNEEILAPGQGVPLHPHENMEIISIPLSGMLRHQDSRGSSHVIAPGEIHILSAGRGVTHWEYNHCAHEPAHYLQIWIKPGSRGTPTHYGHGTIDATNMASGLFLAAAPAGCNGVVEINQDAYVSLARLEPGTALTYEKHRSANGLYLFLIAGRLQAGTQTLARGDGLGLTETPLPAFLALENSTLLCIEVPMHEQDA
jgi:hypothetical protein